MTEQRVGPVTKQMVGIVTRDGQPAMRKKTPAVVLEAEERANASCGRLLWSCGGT